MVLLGQIAHGRLTHQDTYSSVERHRERMHSGVSCLPGDVQLPKPCGSGILADQFDGLFALGELGMALNVMQKADLSCAPREAHGKITKQSVNLDKVTATRVTFHPGAKWSRDLKAYAGTHSCALPHVAMVLQGTLRVVMDDELMSNLVFRH